MSWQRSLDDWVTIATTALHAAHHLNDRHGEATAWNNLGLALEQVRLFEDTITALAQVVAAYIESDAIEAADGFRHGIEAIKDAQSEK